MRHHSLSLIFSLIVCLIAPDCVVVRTVCVYQWLRPLSTVHVKDNRQWTVKLVKIVLEIFASSSPSSSSSDSEQMKC